MILGSGVHSELHPNSHHPIVFVIFDLKLFYPPLYEKLVWHCKYANTGHKKNALASLNGNKRFLIALSIRRFLFLVKQL